MFAWHILDVRRPFFREIAAALAHRDPVVPWMASVQPFGRLREWEREEFIGDPRMTAVRFPLQRGFASVPLLGEHRRICNRILRRASAGARSVLVCCLPQFARVAEFWPGPVVYYATDRFTAYRHWNPAGIAKLEARLCKRAAVVAANSRAVAKALLREAHCQPEKLVLIPNATRRASLLPVPAAAPARLPAEIADLPRPIAGVIGNLGANTDWLLLRDVAAAAPWLSWAFVGPCDARIADPAHARARSGMLRAGNRIRFAGAQPYSALPAYARALDVAVLPYLRVEPTWSGSSTRYYDHLAAGRPMVATPGCAELLDKPPLLTFASNAAGMTAALEALRASGFRDGQEEPRWRASAEATWECRAATMRAALEERL